MKYIKEYIPIDGVKRQNVKITPTSITIHSTNNATSTAKNERDNLAREDNLRRASFHIAVDENEAIECIPLNEKALHSGTSVGNNSSISIEMCESGNRSKVINNTVKLVAQMLHERNWGVNKLKRHYDWSGKNCPSIMSANNWNKWSVFLNDVNKELIRLNKPKVHWGEEYYNNLVKKGVVLTDKRFDDKITRAEAMALVDKTADAIIKMINGVK